ncbi:MAG: PadR family transcriptional regulator [Thermoplasmata archaeon]
MWAYAWGSKRHRGLRVWVLQLLERGPMNGAEIMEEMDRMSMGWWRPSPGSIYPLLDQLTVEKLVRKRDDGRYEVTEAARGGPDWMRGWMGRGPRTPQDALAEMEAYIAFLEDLGRGEKGDLAPMVPRLKAVAKRLDDLVDRSVRGKPS